MYRLQPIWVRVCSVLLLLAQLGFLAKLAWVHSPVFSEFAHLPAGLSHLYLGRFELYSVNPPLVRIVAASPVAFTHPKINWESYDLSPATRSEVAVARDFARANKENVLMFFVLARWACIPFALLGAVICFQWASALYGSAAGLLAQALWCCCPWVLGHASLIVPDAHAAAVGITACWTFRCWLRRPTLWRAIVLGGVMGLAQLTKFTLLVFYPLWLILWILYRVLGHTTHDKSHWLREAVMLAVASATSLYVINLGYGFEGSFKRLGTYCFHSVMLSGCQPVSYAPHDHTNRFANSWLATIPVPLPTNYVYGIDIQKADFERGMRSYLRGEWSIGGWWYYYLYALVVKLPLGTWGLLLTAVGASLFCRKYSAAWGDELLLLVPAITILALVSSQTGVNLHSRYVVPFLPFMYIWISKVGRCIELRHWKTVFIVASSICWSIGSSLWYYPHCISYFNELVGGPRNGHYHLLNSSIAWGQDLFFLRDWSSKHPEAQPLFFAPFGCVDPHWAGIEYSLPPVGPAFQLTELGEPKLGPYPGWYAIDVNYLHGINDPLVNEKGELQCPIDNHHNYSYFLNFEPEAMAGYSIYIYHITIDEANQVRRKLGLPELPKPLLR